MYISHEVKLPAIVVVSKSTVAAVDILRLSKKNWTFEDKNKWTKHVQKYLRLQVIKVSKTGRKCLTAALLMDET